MRGIRAGNPKGTSMADHKDGVGTQYARRVEVLTWELST